MVVAALDDVDGVDLHITEMFDGSTCRLRPFSEWRLREPLGAQPDAPGRGLGQGKGFIGAGTSRRNVAGLARAKGYCYWPCHSGMVRSTRTEMRNCATGSRNSGITLRAAPLRLFANITRIDLRVARRLAAFGGPAFVDAAGRSTTGSPRSRLSIPMQLGADGRYQRRQTGGRADQYRHRASRIFRTIARTLILALSFR